MSIRDEVNKRFNSIRNYENLSYGGLRTLNDIEKEYDKLVEENNKLKERLKKYDEQITN